jgi:HD-like signal output (HDOD) protein
MAQSTTLGSMSGQRSPRPSFAALLDDHLRSPTLSLSICPESADQARRSLSDKKHDVEALVRISSQDPALAATLIREANGPEFDVLTGARSIRKAVIRLGPERVLEVIGSLLSNATETDTDPFVARALRHNWTRSLAIALVTPAIAARTGEVALAQDAHLLGLLSDIGGVFLLSALQASRRSASELPPLTDSAKRELLVQLQGPYGVALLEQWKFPVDLLAVFSGDASGRDSQRKSLFLQVARAVVSSIGFPPAGCEVGGGWDDDELWELSEFLELCYVDVAALQVQAEDLVASLEHGLSVKR